MQGIVGRRVLTQQGLGAARLRFDDAHIGEISYAAADRADAGLLDAGDLLVLPGIVDIHGDAFERAVMPRPNVHFDYGHALWDVDRQLLVNGITTAFHGVTVSWEGGLRGAPYAERMFDALQRHAAVLGAQHQVHLRFETHNLNDVDRACAWIREGRIGFVALNDHLPSMYQRLGNDRKLLQYADRAQCDIDTFSQRIRDAHARAAEVPAAMARLVDCALSAGLQVASHDDPDDTVRRDYDAMGCRVAEFPLQVSTAALARSLGNAVIFGAPNVVRGGSHVNAPSALDMVQAGYCTVLASDYYYPAPLHAVFMMVAQGARSLADAWPLVSANPALAANLSDRGVLATGLRADAILVNDSLPGLPRVVATVVAGRIVFADRSLP
ncbi:alpha-D-ribose 1-methylphosphonate 5-triphosphate diphosphatase [Robbsia sp. KACC 23696]|uniref:alpha-D-ribose 1-methylphosphonate 5-triphosphate diphosphatase n=1 Tax=Robbsia sp. KACC 23696 TaxID=3149231 RepID=UPI00325B0F34